VTSGWFFILQLFPSTPVFQVATVLHISPPKPCLHFPFPPYLLCPNLTHPWGCEEAQKSQGPISENEDILQ
jgi:hypothetical protein